MRRACLMLRWALPAAVCLLAAANPGRAEVTVTPAGSGYDVDVTGQASISELLDAITSATGASIKGQPEEAPVNANQLRGTSIERALRKLLPGAAFAVRYDDDGKPSAIIFLSPDSAGADGAATEDGATQGADDGAATDGDMPDDGATDDGDASQPTQ